ncbi:MAG: tetratricopeptide repeat protein [Chloroflexi bacterium]|nr:tetratricopeptide repeat protein [Chloroflexota bacterium]
MSPTPPPKPIEVFYSYSKDDWRLRAKLEKHLSLLRRQRAISDWHYRKIGAGMEWKGQIDSHLNTARIILLLVSADFLASDYCYDIEMQRAMQRHEAKEARVIPVILRPCDWHSALFGKLEASPENGKPVTQWRNREEAFTNIAQEIRKVVEELSSKPSSRPLPATSPAAGLPPTPIWNVPHARNLIFTGRKRLLTDLRAALTSDRFAALTQAISGLGGVGKTQIAVEYAYRHLTDYDLVWWVRAEEPATLAADYAGLAQPLNLPQKDEADQRLIVQAVRAWLRQHPRWLLIFDNANRPDDLDPYLPRGATGHVLITSRNPVWRQTASPLPISGLKRSEAIAFLLKRSGDTDRAAADKLAGALGDLPLALAQAAAVVEATTGSLASYLDLFLTRRRELWKRDEPPSDYHATVATTWEISFQQVAAQSAAGADLLNLCAFFAPDNIPQSLIAQAAAHLHEPLSTAVQDPLLFGEAVAALRRFSLVEAKGGALSVHRLVQAVARDRLTPESARQWAVAALQIVNTAFPDDSEDVRFWPACALLLPHARSVTDQATALGVASDTAAWLLNQVGLYLRGRAQFVEAKEVFERALKMGEAAYGPQHPTVAIRVNNLGSVLRALGDLAGAKAAFERALTVAEAAYGPAHPTVAAAVNNLGGVLRALGDLAGAKAAFERALTVAEAAYGPAHPSVATVVNNLGGVLQDLGDLAGAKAAFERALAIDEQVYGLAHPSVAIRVNNLGLVLQDLGDLAGAQAAFERALTVDEAAYGPQHPEVATDVNNLGSVLRDLGDLAGAKAAFERALTILRASLGEQHPNTVIVRRNIESLGLEP